MSESVLQIRKSTSKCEKQIEWEGSPEIKRLMCFIFTSTRGGINRMKIIFKLRDTSLNLNRLSQEIDLDYKATQHHIKVLEKNNLIVNSGESYGKLYFLSQLLESNMIVFDEIVLKMKHYL